MKICPSCQTSFDGDSWTCPGCGQSPPLRNGYLAFAPDLADQSEGFEAAFFERLMSVESGNYWFENRNRLILWTLRHYCPAALSSGRFLEIGCGTGFVLSAIHRAFPGLNVVGSEIFVEGLNYAQQRLDTARLLQMDARHIPFVDEFDVVGAFDVLEHIDEDETVLAQLFRAIKPGGSLILTVPQHPYLWSVVDDFSHHFRRYTRSELTTKLRAAGFEILRTTSFVSALLPLVMLSRTLRDRSQDRFDPLAEFRISPIQNRVLSAVLGIERLLIQAGVSFPAGSSLLAVARKR